MATIDGTSSRLAGSCHESPGSLQEKSCSANNPERISADKLQRIYELKGLPWKRDDSWLRAASGLLALGTLPEEAQKKVQEASKFMQRPLLPRVVKAALQALAIAVAKSSVAESALVDLQAHFRFRYHPVLVDALGRDCEQALREETMSIAPPSSAMAGLELLKGGNVGFDKAVQHLRDAVAVNPKDDDAALRLGVALHGMAREEEAISVLQKHAHCNNTANADPRLLAAFAYIVAVTGKGPATSAELVKEALACASSQNGTRGGAVAAIYFAGMASGSVPFDVCERIFKLERDLLFKPFDCHKRLELGVVLRRLTNIPLAQIVGRKLLTSFPFECVQSAEILTGMGQHWIDEPSGASKRLGLAGDIRARADIRTGVVSASYANWYGSMVDGDGVEDVSAHTHMYISQLEVAEQVKRGNVNAHATCTTRREQTEGVERPALADPFGCPHVKPREFHKKCLSQRRPCILRGEGKAFLRHRSSPDVMQRWRELAANATVKVSFPFPPGSSSGLPTLNLVERTSKFFARKDVQAELQKLGEEAPSSTDFPWTLVRPGQLSMMFADAVSWMRQHPNRTAYMNQQMVVDLGEEAVAEIISPDWVKETGMSLLSPSLWLASGTTVTGYHYDAPDNLLVQLSGEKEVVLLRPSEVKHLYYSKVVDVQARAAIRSDGDLEVSGLVTANRSSSGHSVIDIANRATASKFPRYALARGTTCHAEAGDVLYIPSYWHHAVVTQPDKTCTALSLNLWYSYDRPSSFEQAVISWGGTPQDLQAPDDWKNSGVDSQVEIF